MAKITEFKVGYCTHIGCIALKGAGLKVCQFPSRAYLLEANNRQWLWDTGYASWFERYTRSGLFYLYRQITPVWFDPTEALAHQLHQQGITQRQISGIILSHFHADHIAGLRDFPQVTSICSGEGWQKVKELNGLAALRQAFIPGLIPPDFESSLRFIETFKILTLPEALAPFRYGYALPDSDNQIILVPLPGHAPGHTGAFILTECGWTLLAADAAWSPANYQQLRGPSRLANLVMSDSTAFYRTLSQLNQLWKQGSVEIRLCHEGNL